MISILLHRRILITELLVALVTATFPVFLPIYFSDMGFSAFQIGLAFAVVALTAAAVGVASGILEERVNRYKLLAAAYGGYVVLPLFYSLIQSLHHLFTVTIFDGIITAFREGPLYSIFEGASAKKTTVSVSHLEAAVNLAGFWGPLMAGIFLSLYPMQAFFRVASTLLLLGFLIYPKNLGPRHRRMSFQKIHSELQFLEHDIRLHILLAIMFTVSFVLFSKSMALALFMDGLGYSLETIGLVGGLFFVFLAGSEWLAGMIETARTRKLLFSFGLILASVSIFLFPLFSQQWWQLALLALMFSMGVGLIRPAIFAFLVSNHPAYRHFTTGTLFAASRLGIVAGFFSAGVLIEYDFSYYFLLSSGLLFLAFLLSLFLKHPHKR
ncbi:MAG TPA: MFS transporter [Candidatus Bilamarchaeaceae archaeon]|nr:MFS transporter [Candidatus Bilamarchaeaceae archaeon]